MNELRVLVDKQRREIYKLKNMVRQKGGGDTLGALRSSKGAFGPGVQVDSLRSSLEKLDKMLYQSSSEGKVKSLMGGAGPVMELGRGGVSYSATGSVGSKLSKASKNIEEARTIERLLFMEQKVDNLKYQSDIQARAIELLSGSLQERGVDVNSLLSVLGNLGLTVG